MVILVHFQGAAELPPRRGPVSRPPLPASRARACRFPHISANTCYCPFFKIKFNNHPAEWKAAPRCSFDLHKATFEQTEINEKFSMMRKTPKFSMRTGSRPARGRRPPRLSPPSCAHLGLLSGGLRAVGHRKCAVCCFP